MMIILITFQTLRFKIQMTQASILYQEVISYQIFIQSKYKHTTILITQLYK